MSRPLRIFLCHASEDKVLVREFAQRLHKDGFEPWLDEERLLPGQDWDLEISTAVGQCDAVLVCLSPHSTTKVGYVQKEIRKILDIADHHPDGRIFVIPVRLQECAVPARLGHWQRADLFTPGGYERLKAALRVRSAGTDGANAAPPETGTSQAHWHTTPAAPVGRIDRARGGGSYRNRVLRQTDDPADDPAPIDGLTVICRGGCDRRPSSFHDARGPGRGERRSGWHGERRGPADHPRFGHR